MIEHFIRHGNVLTHIVQWTDPVYLTEPLVAQRGLRAERERRRQLAVAVRVRGRGGGPAARRGAALPAGQEPVLGRLRLCYGIPVEAANGGAETMYPEYMEKLRTLPQGRQAGRATRERKRDHA